ncbi:nuclear transport factor 2 family protein [Streptodolium elevatio]|uniref:Nuclear transport factor 2 family protein n=1 Tax=Streptodolium elevatio TaxID=3157996 RepID=A0ABV3DQ36_9ACTN
MTTHPTPADLAAIHQTLALFAHVFDNRDVDGLGLVFTDDVVVESGPGPNRTYRGIAEFAAYARGLSDAAPDHHTLNTAVAVDGQGRVQTRSRYIGVKPDGRLTSGEFLDIFERTPEGWRIRYRRSIQRTPRPEGQVAFTVDFPLTKELDG